MDETLVKCVTNRFSFTAVAPAPTEYEGTNWYITAVSAVLVLLVVAALCVYAPCGCLWKRPRSEVDVNCPITTSEKGMCGNCYLHRNATTKTMTYEERPHHVNITMASNVRHHRPSSGDYSSQVLIEIAILIIGRHTFLLMLLIRICC